MIVEAEDFRIRYGCMEGCNEYEEHGLAACNDCITSWQLYIKETTPRVEGRENV